MLDFQHETGDVADEPAADEPVGGESDTVTARVFLHGPHTARTSHG